MPKLQIDDISNSPLRRMIENCEDEPVYLDWLAEFCSAARATMAASGKSIKTKDEWGDFAEYLLRCKRMIRREVPMGGGDP